MSMTINQVALEGKIADDGPRCKDIAGAQLATFALQVYGGGAGQNRKNMFLDVECWRSIAEEVRVMGLRKGDRLAVSGRLADASWTAQDGTQRTRYKIVAQAVMRLAEVQPMAQQQQGQPMQQAQGQPAPANMPPQYREWMGQPVPPPNPPPVFQPATSYQPAPNQLNSAENDTPF